MYRYELALALLFLYATISISLSNIYTGQSTRKKDSSPPKGKRNGIEKSFKRNLRIANKEPQSVPYIVLPPDNSIPDDGKVLTKKIINGLEISSFATKPTQRPTQATGVTVLHRSPLPTALPNRIQHIPNHVPSATAKPININIIVPTAPTRPPTTPRLPTLLHLPTTGEYEEQEHENHTTIDVNLNIGEDDHETAVQEKQPIIIQVIPTTPRTVAPPDQQLLASIASNLQRPLAPQPNVILNPNQQIPLGFPQVTLRGLVNGGINNNYPVTAINNFPLPGINTNFPGSRINTNVPVPVINTNLPVTNINTNIPVTGINTNFPVAGPNAIYPVPGINNVNSIPLFEVNNNVPGNNLVPGINTNLPFPNNNLLNNGLTANFPATANNNFPGTIVTNYPGIINNPSNMQPENGGINMQSYPATDTQQLQRLSSVISESIKSSMALSKPEIIANALQKLAIQTQNANHPEQLVSNALTEALTRAVGLNGEVSQQQKLTNSLATALNMLNNPPTGVPGVSNYPAQTPNQMPLKVEVVNMPQQPAQSTQIPLLPASTSTVPGNKFMDDQVAGTLATNSLGKAMATALVNTAKNIVTGVQRDKISKAKDLRDAQGNLAKFLRNRVFDRLKNVKYRSCVQGHKPLSRTFLKIQRQNRCCCCCN